jgi:hypothetical protein
MLRDNPLVQFASLYARVVAAGIYQEAKLSQKRAEVLQDAARDVEALDRSIELPNSVFAMWHYFEEIGDNRKALEVARRSFERTEGKSPTASFYSVVSHYQQREFKEALQLLDQRRQPDLLGDELRLFLLAELPDGPLQALAEYQRFAKTYTKEGMWPIRTKVDVLLFLGRKKDAQALLRTVRSPTVFSQHRTLFWNAMRQFAANQLSDKACLEKAGTSRFQQCIAHYQIGIFRLAEGDRKDAKDHFQKAVDTRAIWIVDWAWSKMFLSRLKNDDTWPRWIQAKK